MKETIIERGKSYDLRKKKKGPSFVEGGRKSQKTLIRRKKKGGRFSYARGEKKKEGSFLRSREARIGRRKKKKRFLQGAEQWKEVKPTRDVYSPRMA